MISNINFKGFISDNELLRNLDYGTYKPQQCIKRYEEYTIVIFKSGKCRIMGCKSEPQNLTFPIHNIELQSITVTLDMCQSINLFKLSKILKNDCIYEPELFTALRVTRYNPLCVNVFATGKVVILGIKSIDYQYLLDTIIDYLCCFIGI